MPKRCRKPTAVSLLISLAVMITSVPATGADLPGVGVPHQARWAPWRDLLQVPPADLPQAV
ncbi:MAG TPA: hypothetical protein VNE62_13140, partial [Actinomycetota bacterium]|nr:hypothetical protein [Actinomycetota bacterium]